MAPAGMGGGDCHNSFSHDYIKLSCWSTTEEEMDGEDRRDGGHPAPSHRADAHSDRCPVALEESEKAHGGLVPRPELTHSEGASGNSTRSPECKYCALRSQTKPSQKLPHRRSLPWRPRINPRQRWPGREQMRGEFPKGSQPPCHFCWLNRRPRGGREGCSCLNSDQH